MSFLLLEDDRAALEEALAFIDAHADALPALASLSSPSPPSSPSPASAPAPPKRVRDPAVYARRRLKKKAELQTLRLQAKALETQLAQHRRSLAGHKPLLTADDAPPTDGDVTSDGSVSSPVATSESTKTLARRRQRQARRAADWFVAALNEHKRRRAAEQLNAQLRAALEAQVALARRFQGFLDGYSAPEVFDTPEVTGASMKMPARLGAMPTKVAAELRATSQRLMLEACTRVDLTGAEAVACDYCVKHDPLAGVYAEMRTAAPLEVELSELATVIMDRLFAHDKCFEPVEDAAGFEGVSSDQITVNQHNRAVEIEVDGQPLRMQGTTLLCKVDTPERVVITFCSLLFHPSGRLSFREGGWISFTPSPADPSRACVSRSCARLASEAYGDASDMEQVRAQAMNRLGERTRVKHQGVQRRLLLETGRPDLAAFVVA